MAGRRIKGEKKRGDNFISLPCQTKLAFFAIVLLLVTTLSRLLDRFNKSNNNYYGGSRSGSSSSSSSSSTSSDNKADDHAEYDGFFAPTVQALLTTTNGTRTDINSSNDNVLSTYESPLRSRGARESSRGGVGKHFSTMLQPSRTSYNNNNINNNNASVPTVSTTPNRPLFVSQDGKEFTHFFIHIPKVGGTYAFRALSQLFFSNQEMARRPKDKQFRPCTVGAIRLQFFERRYPYDFKGVKCTMWHSESAYDYSMEAQHTYAIVRDPRQQMLSMYFHCTESKHKHKRKKMDMKLGKMATPAQLDTWMGMYMDVIDDPYKAGEVFNSLDCPYNPINFQSSHIRFVNYGSNDKYKIARNSADNQQKQQRLINGTATIQEEEHAKQDLKNRFDVLGDMAQMDKTVCAILIKYAGWVPDPCNCTTTTTTTTSKTEEAAAAEGVVKEYDINKHSHNVKHHGATAKTTPEEDEKIVKLAALDFKLYDVAKEIFAEQVKEIEEEHGIVVCDKFRQET